ncbi:MAG: hypothetical protein ACTS4U_00055 [Candidatus Hodgkinia cicadicola]
MFQNLTHLRHNYVLYHNSVHFVSYANSLNFPRKSPSLWNEMSHFESISTLV